MQILITNFQTTIGFRDIGRDRSIGEFGWVRAQCMG